MLKIISSKTTGKICPFCSILVEGKANVKFCGADHRNKHNSLEWLKREKIAAMDKTKLYGWGRR
jgi:hypothetical protein